MKKFISLVMSIVMVLSLSVCAFAMDYKGVEGTYKVTVADKDVNEGMGWVLVYDGDELVDYVVIIDDWYGFINLNDDNSDLTFEYENVLLEQVEDMDIDNGFVVPVFDFEDNYTDAECFA